MKSSVWISVVFGLAAIYDGVLGLVFLIAPLKVFDLAHVTPPNHAGYVQFPAAVLLIFGLMFAQIARDPNGHRGLILYGILLKVAYCGVAGGYWLKAGIPGMWKPFVIMDLIMGLLFAWSYTFSVPKISAATR